MVIATINERFSNMERNKDYFVNKLDKDTYTKDDVANLLFSEAEYTSRSVKKEYADYVSPDAYNELEIALNATKEQLAPYKEQEFKQTISQSMQELNGDTSRVDDFIKLSGISQDMDIELIKAKTLEMKESKNYEFLFPTHNSGGTRHTQHTQEQIKTNNGPITPKMGLIDSLFKKKD